MPAPMFALVQHDMAKRQIYFQSDLFYINQCAVRDASYATGTEISALTPQMQNTAQVARTVQLLLLLHRQLAKACSSSSGKRGIVTRHLVPWWSSSHRLSSANFAWGEAFLSHKWMLASDSVALSHQLLQICWVRPAD